MTSTSSATPTTEASSRPMREQVEQYIFSLQDSIVSAFEKLDPNAPQFKRDSWLRAQGGKGCSCVFAMPADAAATTQTETILEKAGVNISVVHGTLPPAGVKQMRADHSSLPDPPAGGLPFFAAGLSLVVHPRNPHAPTVHMNYRYFEVTEALPPTIQSAGATMPDGSGGGMGVTGAPDEVKAQTPAKGKVLAWWFGGGADLTPSYLYDEDAAHFHRTLKTACDAHSAAFYPAWKAWCDTYFHIPHRGETRGVGGIFFDDLNDEPHKRLPMDASPELTQRPRTADDIFAYVRAMGDAFVPAYLPILERRCKTPSTPHERRWQLIRRGRYVEFNLIYDRGTKFGLNTPGARIESILMSLPETARWEYMSEMGSEEGTEEARLLEVLKNPREWV